MDLSHMALSALVASLLSLVIGFIWYNPKVFGTAWMRLEGLNQDNLKKSNFALTMGLTMFFAFLIAFMVLPSVTIHQMGVLGCVGGDPTQAKPSYAAFMTDYGTAFRTFKHGALHGTILGLGLAFPLIAVNNMYGQKPWKLTFIQAGYWIVTLAIMGGIVCGWSESGFHFA